ALADEPQDAIAADALRQRPRRHCVGLGRCAIGIPPPACQRALEDTFAVLGRGLEVVRQEALDLGAEFRVAGASALEERRTFLGGQRSRAIEQVPHLFTPFLRHEDSPNPPRRRDSHARARRQSRLTVLADWSRTAAVSSTLSPL